MQQSLLIADMLSGFAAVDHPHASRRPKGKHHGRGGFGGCRVVVTLEGRISSTQSSLEHALQMLFISGFLPEVLPRLIVLFSPLSCCLTYEHHCMDHVSVRRSR